MGFLDSNIGFGALCICMVALEIILLEAISYEYDIPTSHSTSPLQPGLEESEVRSYPTNIPDPEDVGWGTPAPYWEPSERNRRDTVPENLVSHAAGCINPLNLEESFLDLSAGSQRKVLRNAFNQVALLTHS